MMGATNDNLEEVLKTNPKNVAGVKIFLEVHQQEICLLITRRFRKNIFESTLLIAVHCERKWGYYIQ
jgi:dihydroorotase